MNFYPTVIRMLRKTRVHVVIAACVVLVLSACGSESDGDADDGTPAKSIAIRIGSTSKFDYEFELPPAEENRAFIDYSTDPGQVTVVTWGSSSCPAYPTSITWSNPTTLAIAMSEDYGDKACTADLGPNFAVIEVPPNQDGNEADAVVLNGNEIEVEITS